MTILENFNTINIQYYYCNATGPTATAICQMANSPVYPAHLGGVNCTANILIFAKCLLAHFNERANTAVSRRGPPINLPALPEFPRVSRFPGVPRRAPALINDRHGSVINQTMEAKCIYYCLDTLRTPNCWPQSARNERRGCESPTSIAEVARS